MFVFLMTTSLANAQIIECVNINDTNTGVQFAKYKFEKLRSANGTIYEKGAYDYTNERTYFSAITNRGIEKIWLSNKPLYFEDLAIYPATISVIYTNGMKLDDVELSCFDLLRMNEKRVNNGTKPSPITVSDF